MSWNWHEEGLSDMLGFARAMVKADVHRRDCPSFNDSL